MIDFFKNLKITFLLMALASIVLGIVMTAKADLVSKIICFIIGALLCVCGIFEISAVFIKPSGGIFSANRMIPGILALAVGLLFLFRSEAVFSILWIFIGLVVLIDGIYKLQYSFELRQCNAPQWWLNLVTALCAIVLSVVLMLQPLDTTAAMIILSGAVLIASGVFDLVCVVMLSLNAKRMATSAVVTIEDAPDETDLHPEKK